MNLKSKKSRKAKTENRNAGEDINRYKVRTPRNRLGSSRVQCWSVNMVLLIIFFFTGEPLDMGYYMWDSTIYRG